MNSGPLGILDFLIREKPTRANRSTNLLKDPDKETGKDWHVCVPPCFNDALDIKKTEQVKEKKKRLVWTQGSSFSFKCGDTLYDSPTAYSRWSEALKSIRFCFQVKHGISTVPAKNGTERFSGQVIINVLTPNRDRTKLEERLEHTMSQDDFVKMLISGPPEELKRKIPMA